MEAGSYTYRCGSFHTPQSPGSLKALSALASKNSGVNQTV